MLTDRHHYLLRALCQIVRVVTEDQAGDLMELAGRSVEDVKRDLGGLVQRDLLRRDRVLVRRLPPFSGPLVCGGPGVDAPDFAALAAALVRRWDVPAEVTAIYRPGPAARRVFGTATGGGQNLAALSHDVACADLLLAFAAHHPERLGHWVGDDARKADLRPGEKLPDVILYGEDRAPYLVCELAGIYPRHRLEDFHAFTVGVLNLPYELW